MELDVRKLAQGQQFIEHIEDESFVQRHRRFSAQSRLEPGLDIPGQRSLGEEDDGGAHWKIVN